MEYYEQCHQTNQNGEQLKEEPFVFHITNTSKFTQNFRAALKILKEHGKIHLVGVGPCVTQAVNIVEDLKSKFRNISQSNQVFYTQVKEVWIPKSEEVQLDSLEVTRNIPCLKIILCKGKLDGSISFEEEDRLNKEMIHLLRKEAKLLRSKKKSSPRK